MYDCPSNSLPLYFMSLNVAGLFSSNLGSDTLARMAACGHTSVHLLHWMQRSVYHTGISIAMLRFSHCAVPVGNVPSTGKALTGSWSPRPAMISAVTSCTNFGASLATMGGILIVLDATAGTLTSIRLAMVWSTARKFFWTTSSPFFV